MKAHERTQHLGWCWCARGRGARQPPTGRRAMQVLDEQQGAYLLLYERP